jgi:hypothetical protein
MSLVYSFDIQTHTQLYPEGDVTEVRILGL